MRMIWYRHWLEIRYIVGAVAAFVLLMAGVYAFAVHGVTSYFAGTGRFAGEVAQYRYALNVMSAEAMMPWALHTQFTSFLAIVAPVVLYGNGYASQQRLGPLGLRHPSVLTLSLPISRFEVVWTRFAAGAAAMTAVFALSLAAHLAAAAAIAGSPAIAWMTVTTLLAIAGGILVLAVMALLTVVVKEPWAGLAAFSLFLVLWFAGWSQVTAFLAVVEAPWVTLGAVLAMSAAALALTVLGAYRREI